MQELADTRALPNVQPSLLREAFVCKDCSAKFFEGGSAMSCPHVSFVFEAEGACIVAPEMLVVTYKLNIEPPK